MSWRALSGYLSEHFNHRRAALVQLKGLLKIYALFLPGQPYLLEFLELLLDSRELLEGEPVSAREVHSRLERLEQSMRVQEGDFQRVRALLERLLDAQDVGHDAHLSSLSELKELDRQRRAPKERPAVLGDRAAEGGHAS